VHEIINILISKKKKALRNLILIFFVINIILALDIIKSKKH